MRRDVDTERRATRLLRWYPRSWRERYGDEFVDHLEQGLAERPIDLRRSVNVGYKGLIARLGDLGLSNSGVTSYGQSRASLGTSFALVALMIVVMLDLWSRAMLAWSGRQYHPIPVSATTGVLTVAMGLLLVALAAIVVVVAISVALQIIRGRARPLVGPSILVVSSGGLLLYAARYFPRMLTGYIHGGHGFQGIALSRPGQFITAMAEIAWQTTQSWVAAWNQGMPQISRIQTVVNNSVLVAMFVFGIALALLIRRVELPRFSRRLLLPAAAFLSAASGVFFITYLAWSAFGGPSNYEYFFPERPWLGVLYLIILGLVPLLSWRSAVLIRRSKPPHYRNRIDVIGPIGEST